VCVCVCVCVCGLTWVSLCDVMSRLDNILAVFRSTEQNASCCEFDEGPPLPPSPPPPPPPRERARKELQPPVIAAVGKLGTGPCTIFHSFIHHYFELHRITLNCLFALFSSDVQDIFLRGCLLCLSSLLYVCAFIYATYMWFISRLRLTSATSVAGHYRSLALILLRNKKLGNR
jgi:hypothetical protein